MNEKVKELAEQAGYKPLPGFDFANSLEEAYIKKFAKLIINECVTLSDNTCQGSEFHDEGTVFYYNANIGDKIKQYFGVK